MMHIIKKSITAMKLLLLLALLPQIVASPAMAGPSAEPSFVCTNKGSCKMYPICDAQRTAMKGSLDRAAKAGEQLESKISKNDYAAPADPAGYSFDPQLETPDQLLEAIEIELCSVNTFATNCKAPARSTKSNKTAWKDLGEMTIGALDRIDHIRKLIAKGSAKVPRATLQSAVHDLVADIYGLDTLLASSAQ